MIPPHDKLPKGVRSVGGHIEIDCGKCGAVMWYLKTEGALIVFRCSRIGCGHTDQVDLTEGAKA